MLYSPYLCSLLSVCFPSFDLFVIFGFCQCYLDTLFSRKTLTSLKSSPILFLYFLLTHQISSFFGESTGFWADRFAPPGPQPSAVSPHRILDQVSLLNSWRFSTMTFSFRLFQSLFFVSFLFTIVDEGLPGTSSFTSCFSPAEFL